MTTYSTPTAHAAYLAGMTEDAFLAAQDAAVETVEHFGEYGPADEDANLVPENDVKDADTGLVWGYGGDHRVYFPAADE